NGNGVPDLIDILIGTSADKNRNGVPDECDLVVAIPVPIDDIGDAQLYPLPDQPDGLGVRRQDGPPAQTPADLSAFVAHMLAGHPVADLNHDGVIGPADLAEYVHLFQVQTAR